MLTLADIDAKFPETHDGSVFSDLYKSAYGSRPRGLTFTSIEHFEQEWNRVVQHANDAADDEARYAQISLERLEGRIAEIQAVMPTSTKADIIRYIADAEEVDGDLEYLDWKLGVKYGTCKRLSEEV